MHPAHFVSAFLVIGNILACAANRPELPHFFEVEPGFYRGAQPKDPQFALLAQMGVRTVISLRSTGDRIERERKLVESLGMRFISIPLRGYRTPPDEQIQRALAEIEAAQASGNPVFVHCKLGKDRTGTVVACFRMKHRGWTGEKALQEAKSLGMSRRQWKMQHYVLEFASRLETSVAR